MGPQSHEGEYVQGEEQGLEPWGDHIDYPDLRGESESEKWGEKTRLGQGQGHKARMRRVGPVCAVNAIGCPEVILTRY